MFSGRIGFIAYQQGLGLIGQTRAVHENDDHRAAAEAAMAAQAETAAPKRSGSPRQFLLNLLAAVF